jgi:S-adenosylmethionine:tRNA ribosyltransferase-isomerase
LKTSDFDYHLPVKYIAQTPLEPRDAARLLVLDREGNRIEHTKFRNIGDYLRPHDLLVLNETRVLPARLFAAKIPGGGKVELLLLHKENDLVWEVLVGGKGLTENRQLRVENGPSGVVLDVLTGPRRLIQFSDPIEPYLEKAGHVPLPPYIKAPLEDPERYQTVYAQQVGSAAAPTAGLHFTKRLMAGLADAGVNFTSVTLHVGLDTFAPVNEDDPRQHVIHTEWCQLSEIAAQTINQARRQGGRIIAVGTTSVRTLESATNQATAGEVVSCFEGQTDLFIIPGYKFRAVDALVTNFHLPRSTLLMLVSAFAGRETMLDVYQLAKKENYRFYSFGDAMLIL